MTQTEAQYLKFGLVEKLVLIFIDVERQRNASLSPQPLGKIAMEAALSTVEPLMKSFKIDAPKK